ncbi:MAG: filamentous hemagglutinin N-terminal domain-containing protein, partial [Oceanococcus sp.]
MSKASMNHVYRLVWSDSLGGYVPVAETTKARGKRGRTTRIVGFIAGLTMSSLAMAQGATLISGSNATVEAAQNGVPVVNIEAANGSGLSHNRFTQYNVGSEGLVLNNVTSGSAVTNLAGAIRANPNLQSAASIILNEVVENNRSLLSGYTEVGGTSADVVVANPFGITCNGCGFLNTSHVTLSTGVPQINGASLQFGISGGDIRVVGEGLDATRQNVLDLVARSVVLAGQINAQELNIAAGSGNWNRDNNSFEGGANNSGLAFDSTALGGMYANQITIRVTDQGAGVRMLGNAAATAGDLRITSNGVLEVASNISAANDIQLSTSSDDVSAVALNDASLSAGGNLNVSAVDGGGAVSEGLMFAEANLNLELASLTDTVSSVDSDEQSNRYAGGDLTLSISDELSIDGARWAGAGDVDASAETVSLTGAALVSGGELSLSAQNDLNLGDSLISSVGTLLLNAGGAVSTLAGDAQGVIAAVGDAILQAANLDNAGDIEAVEGSVTLDISEEATNSGIIRAGGDISLGGALGEGASLALTNSGTLLAGMSVNLSATEMNNSGDIQGRTDVQLQGDSLDNSGRLRAVGGESATLELRLASILNNGVVVAGTALTIAEVTNFENRDIFYAGENLTIGDADTALNFINAAEAFMQAGGTFSLDAGGSAVGEQRGSLLGETISIRAAALANAGRIQSGTDSSYVLESSLQNSGELIAGSAMNAEAGSFNNAENALIQAETGVVFNIVDSLDNAGAMYLTGQDFRPEQNSAGSTLSAANIINSGMISSNADLALNLDGEFLQNNDEISVAGSLYINSFGDGLDIRNQGGAVLQAQGNSLRVEGANVSLFNGVGGVLAGNAVELQLQNLDNLGDLVSGEGGVRIAASGEFLNSGTLSAGNDSGGDAEITANTVNNIGPAGRVQSYNNLSFNVSTSLDNSGLILAGNSLFINSNEGSLDVGNHLGGLIQASNDGNSQLLINLAGGALNNRDSAVIFADALTVNAGQINNQGVDSALQAIGDLSLTVGQLDNGALILSGLELQVDTQSLTNAGYIGAGSSSSSTIAVASPLVNSGRISFGDAANGGSGTVSTTGTLSNTAGAFIQAAGTLRLELAGAINNAGTILADIVSIVGSNLNVNNQTGGVLEGRQSLLFSAPIASLINQNQAGIYGLSGSLNLTQLTNLGDLYG